MAHLRMDRIRTSSSMCFGTCLRAMRLNCLFTWRSAPPNVPHNRLPTKRSVVGSPS